MWERKCNAAMPPSGAVGQPCQPRTPPPPCQYPDVSTPHSRCTLCSCPAPIAARQCAAPPPHPEGCCGCASALRGRRRGAPRSLGAAAGVQGRCMPAGRMRTRKDTSTDARLADGGGACCDCAGAVINTMHTWGTQPANEPPVPCRPSSWLLTLIGGGVRQQQAVPVSHSHAPHQPRASHRGLNHRDVVRQLSLKHAAGKARQRRRRRLCSVPAAGTAG